jgi:hypothetical protein
MLKSRQMTVILRANNYEVNVYRAIVVGKIHITTTGDIIEYDFYISVRPEPKFLTFHITVWIARTFHITVPEFWVSHEYRIICASPHCEVTIEICEIPGIEMLPTPLFSL